jgi:hypothetical protein
MSLDRKILEELRRINQINNYILKEQGDELTGAPPTDPAAGEPPTDPAAGEPPADPAAEAGAPPTDPAAGAPPTDPAAGGGGPEVPEPIDVANDPDVEEVGVEGAETEGEGDEEAEEIDITDLVTSQKEMKDKQDEIMDTMFSKLDDLQAKLANIDQIMNRINSLETKFDKYRDKTPEEKLMLRSLDSYPYNQKLTDFFDDKKIEMDKTDKNEYVLTSDEIENFSPNEIKGTFNDFDEEEEKLSEMYYRRNRRLL